MATDLLCQEMGNACWDCPEPLGSPCSLCSQCWEDSLAEEWDGREHGKSTVTATTAFLSPWWAVTVKERDVVGENKEEEGM